MEKMNSARINGVVRLPPGFRFHPTDEELVVQYLKRKVFSCPLPASIIPEIDVCKYDPWDLPGNSSFERYFFTIRESKHSNGNRVNRAAASGYWKATGSDKDILASRNNQVVGMKKTLVFYIGKATKGSRSKTDWIMHEYRLPNAATKACIFPQRKNSTQNLITPMRDWVLCRIFLKKRSNYKDDVGIIRACSENTVGKLQRAEEDVTTSDSGTSGLTHLSSAGSVNEECNSISSSLPGR